ncbi:helix-turn-helix domain-containing protein [Pseudohalocynthiibacter sp. F2068]|uniref:helix-turn-helix domain-containing protein n=1 Tax=Pseudohalocynthiibacter sp. F2068 TaxID=2926418 RepID=UPI001FF208F6|nr:helix-turn-helix domain-containing protein [Pseudohalocynthiibacter sp. F2068]MCK0102349.1 helix-turn-helix domain-containing protein [Pseudohalocynthiibacter sp. F2068]
MGKSDKQGKGKEQYVNMPYPMLRSKAWRSLSGAAVKIWFELHSRFHGGNNGTLHLSMNEAAEILGLGKATVKRGFDELQAKGFIVLEKEGAWYHRRAHEWRLTTKPVVTRYKRSPATNDWRKWQPPEKSKRGSNADPSSVSVVPFQNPRHGHGSETEPVRTKSAHSLGSKSEH